jgi:hypothetical protein
LPELDQAFGDASVRDARRGRRIRNAIAASAATVLVAGVIALSVLYRASTRNAEEARDKAAEAKDKGQLANLNAEKARAELAQSHLHRGQQYLLDGDYQRALPFLVEASKHGDRSRGLRLMLHRAMTLAMNPRIGQPHFFFGDPTFRPDGKNVISVADDGSALIVDAMSGHVVARLPGIAGDKRFRSATSADGSLVATTRGTSILLWDGATTRTIEIGVELVAETTRIALDATGSRIAIAANRELSVWDARAGQRLWSRPIAAKALWLRWGGVSA